MLTPNLSSKKSSGVTHSEKKSINNEASTSISDEIGHQSGDDDVEYYTHEIKEKLSIDIHLRLLKDIQGGRYLIPDENCMIELEKLNEIPVQNKSSQYWMTFNDHKGKEVKTEARSYI